MDQRENIKLSFWEKCWESRPLQEYRKNLSKWYKYKDPIVDILKGSNVVNICDSACGFGAYSLMLASNGFNVTWFDISQKSVEITKELLAEYGFDANSYKTTSILNTNFPSNYFDAVTARSVLDHLSVEDARLAIEELFRITKKDGLVVVSFDDCDDEDINEPHEILADGSFLYPDGLLLKFYPDYELEKWMSEYEVLKKYTNKNKERFFVLRKTKFRL